MVPLCGLCFGVEALARGRDLFVGYVVIVVHHFVYDAVWRQLDDTVAHRLDELMVVR